MLLAFGEVAEWLKAPLSKSGIPFIRDRGFESHPLRHFHLAADISRNKGGRLAIAVITCAGPFSGSLSPGHV